MTTQLTWECRYCAKPISDGQGYVYIDKTLAYEVEEATKKWNADNAGGWISGDSILSYPEPAKWITCHRECDPDQEGNSYWIDVARIRTTEKLLRWTAHLMGKTWTAHTNWPSVIGSKSGELS